MLGKQLSDGGWAIGAEEADPDVTAMVLQALAPYQSNTAVKNAVSLGVQRLSKLQNDDGGYTSWGYTSSESCSQVVLTLCALGISMDDSRFVKNGHTLTENLLDLPKIISPGNTPSIRCCIYKERAILGERIKIAMGGDKTNPNVIEVMDIACDECPVGGYVVTDSCRGCLAHRLSLIHISEPTRPY